jgi:hypothetical protein
MPRKATAVENTTPIQAIEAVAEPTGNGSIPPPDAPQDVGKYARFLVDDTVTATTGDVAVCTVGVPGKTSFFRAHPDPAFYPHLRCLVFEGEGRKHTYLVDPSLGDLPELEGLLKIQRACPYITHHGAIGIWMISIEYDDNPWIRSALNILEEAKTRWVGAVSVKKQAQYRKQYPTRDYGKPPWPTLGLEGWLDLAFTADDWITDRDHPILKKIRGE